MVNITNSISNRQESPYANLVKTRVNGNTNERFSKTLDSEKQVTSSEPSNKGINGDLQQSFNKLLNGDASETDISSMQKALFNSLTEALFKESEKPPTVLSQEQTSLTGAANSNGETSNTFWNFVDSASTLSFGEDGLGLDDAFDAVNVLNHIPIVSDIYKDATSQDKTDAAAAVAGGYMFAGPAGALYSAANAVTEEITGSSIIDNLITLGRSFLDDDSSASQAIANANTSIVEDAVQANSQ